MSVVRTPVAIPPLPSGRPRLVVTGFMGTGKTAAGRLAARALSLPFFDLDEAVERRTGRSVSGLLVSRGEPAFRWLEAEAVSDASRLSGAVVATGGGACLSPGWPPLAAGSEVAVLTAEVSELVRRLRTAGTRPLLEGDLEERVRALLASRAGAYRSAGRSLDTSRLSPDEVAARLACRYAERGEAGLIRVTGPDGDYPVILRRGAAGETGSIVAERLAACHTAVVVTDPAVATVAHRVASSLAAAGIAVAGPLVVPPGEAAKTAPAVETLWSEFAASGIDRTGVVVVVGGGATIDAAGFAAATFARGVAVVNVPTTLLAMVDAAVGGKVAIDHAGTKNLAGAFHDPAAVIADVETLRSLPDRDLRAGLAEVVKSFVVGSPLALDALEWLRLRELGPDLTWAVEQSVRIKGAFVAADPFDRGPRHALNLGHTFAHALEAATGYWMQHGEAVAIGLVAAARLAVVTGIGPADLPERLAGILSGLDLPTECPPGIERGALLAAMAGDKKRRAGSPVVVLPGTDGIELVEGLDPREVLDALMVPARETV